MARKTGFDAYDVAIEIACAMRPLVEKIRRHDKELADQAQSATQSIGNNIAEGRRRTKGDRIHLFRIALGSTGETQSTVDQAEAWGYLQAQETTDVLALLDREQAMLWKLTH